MNRWDRHRLDMAARALIVIEGAGLPQDKRDKRGCAVQFACGDRGAGVGEAQVWLGHGRFFMSGQLKRLRQHWTCR